MYRGLSDHAVAHYWASVAVLWTKEATQHKLSFPTDGPVNYKSLLHATYKINYVHLIYLIITNTSDCVPRAQCSCGSNI